MADINKIKLSSGTYDIKDTSKLPLAGGTMNQNAAIKWEPENGLTPYIGPCTNSTDGTFLFGSLEGTVYSDGLCIGGSSKNLLWKGKRIVTANGDGATGTWGINISGNASTATQFSETTTVALTGDVTGTSAASKKGWSVNTTLGNSGVTAGNYGPSANASPGHGSTFSVPYFTVDAKGRVTAASTKTITLPSDANTHYTTGITAGATGTTTNAAATNPYVKIKDDSTHRGQIQFKGSGATTVKSDANGVITISSTDNNTVTTASTTGSGNAVTAVSASNGALTVTKGDTFVNLSSAQTISGVKTFSNGIKIGSATLSYNSTASALVLSFS